MSKSVACKYKWIYFPPLTFAEVDWHALGLEQAVVLVLGGALGLRRSVTRRGFGQRVRQGGRGGRGGGGRWGGGRGVYFAVDWRDAAGPARHGWSDELPAKAQQAAGDFVDVEGGCFCTGAGARERTERIWDGSGNKGLHSAVVLLDLCFENTGYLHAFLSQWTLYVLGQVS